MPQGVGVRLPPSLPIKKMKYILITIIISILFSPEAYSDVASNKEYIPLKKVVPTYPWKALKDQIVGVVNVEFTIKKNGSVTDLKISNRGCAYLKDRKPFDCDIFDKTSLEAASRLKYSPQKKRVKNVIHQFTYKID